jgi:hypothetical protein
MSDPAAFAKLVPGFDFLQGLIKNAGNGLPGMGQWIAPTLDPEELEKRIRDLRTVQFWLEQNAKMIGATVQALEVQRMTLATLKTMNVPVDAMRESMKMRPPEPAEPAAAAPAAPAVDPMQWWTALTQQFGDLAASAMKELPTPAAAPKAASAPAKKAAAKRRPR